MEMKPEKTRWCSIARESLARSVAARPSEGELHHDPGVLGRNAQDEELRAMYHSAKRCVLGSLLRRCDAQIVNLSCAPTRARSRRTHRRRR
jgi:hypothetical protein